jgi:chorismate-pyruvate lyase/acyl carrier protein
MRQDLDRSLIKRSINPLTLSAFQRILLTTDGTLTEILEAFAGESIRVVKLFQEVCVLDQAVSALELPWGASVLRRKILLQGRMSLVNFIYAESIIALDRLDEGVRNGLLQSQKPIGLLILERRIETFKEIVDCGREPAGSLADYFPIAPDAAILSRTYRMITNAQPIMLITEMFPESYFRDWDPTAMHAGAATPLDAGALAPPTGAADVAGIVTGLEQFVRRTLLAGTRAEPIAASTDLLTEQLLDANRLFALLGFITEEFGVRFDDDELVPDNFRTLGDIAARIAERQAPGGAARA